MPEYTFGSSFLDPSERLSRQQIARKLLGEIEWSSETEGLCKCPGEHLHTTRNGKKDCKVFIGFGEAPTVHCFHDSCSDVIAAKNKELQSEIGRVEFFYKGGSPAAVIPFPDAAQEGAQRVRERLSWIISTFSIGASEEAIPDGSMNHFRRHLKLFEKTDRVWHGEPYDSRQIKTAYEWYQSGEICGNFISHSTFKPDAKARKNEYIESVTYLVVESDELPKSDQLAVFGWLRDWAGWDLRMILDTAGKSLHGWFKWPSHLEKSQIKALLDALRCDPRLMTPSQPVRVAGAMRDGRMQSITWLGSGLKTEPKSWEELTSFPDQEEDDGEEFGLSRLLEFDTKNDPNALLGARYICRKQSLQIVGESGIGKSSLAVQMAILWALGMAFFGITPKRALRIVLIQRENDEGDMAEEFQGVIKGLGLTSDQIAILRSNIRIWQNNTGTGFRFAQWMEKKITHHGADIVIVDPLISFMDGDLSKQQDATRFCRHEIQPVLNRTGAALIAMHHTGKPKGKKDQADSFGAGKYMGLGSSEFTNWFRANATLTQIGANVFALKLEKRGKRAGMTDTEGKPTIEVKLKHAKDGIFWEQIHRSTVQGNDGVEYSTEGTGWSQTGEEWREKGITMMPPLKHDKRDLHNSQVLPWIATKLACSREEANEAWEAIRQIGAHKHHRCNRVVVFDNRNKLWKGSEYEE